jgi:hypothetical protein
MAKYKFAKPFDIVRDLYDLQRKVKQLEIQIGPLSVGPYTPTWRGASTDPTLNNGSIRGRFYQQGSVIIININLSIGSTTLLGSGQWSFSLPVPVTVNAAYSGACFAEHGNGTYIGVAILQAGASTCYVQTGLAEGTWDGSGTNPFAWGAGDLGVITAQYEVD